MLASVINFSNIGIYGLPKFIYGIWTDSSHAS